MEVDLREPWTSAPSSRLERANPCTQIGLSSAHPGPADTATNIEQHKSSRQVTQGRLHMSDIDLYPNPTKWTQKQYNWQWASGHSRVLPN